MSRALVVDPKLVGWATVRQLEYIKALEKFGSSIKAAKHLGVSKTAITDSMSALKKKAAKFGYAPEYDLTHPVAPGQMLKGASTLYKDGKPVIQWVKTSADQEQMEAIMRAGFDAMATDLPREKPVPMPKDVSKKLANLYTLTDTHIGALCWEKENLDPNGNWDLKIAERVLTDCFRQMVESTPSAGTGIVAQLGDFLHQDGLLPVTPLHAHVLDSDGRFPKIIEAAVRILRRVIAMALAKHKKVILLIAEGNHDMSSSVWLRTMFKALYENEPRLEVIDSVLPYYVYQHGSTMLAWHHGHLSKNDQLPILFASQFPLIWGSTTRRYAHCGHRHHVEIKEHSGMTVNQHSTLAARDAYASRGGWMSERQATAYTYHSERGQVGSVTVTPEMVE
jgi:hypothetical protein